MKILRNLFILKKYILKLCDTFFSIDNNVLPMNSQPRSCLHNTVKNYISRQTCQYEWGEISQPTEGHEDNQLLLRLEEPILLPTHSRKGTHS